MAQQQQHDRTAWFNGGAANCRTPPQSPMHPYRLVLLGPPGVGKGTQAEFLAAALNACHLSTGDVFRAASKNDGAAAESKALAAAQEAMRRGELVSDETVVEMVRERTK